MKKFVYFAAIALAAVATSCGYKSVETPLNDELISFTAKTDDGSIVYGVKNVNGDEIIPARYEGVSIYAGNILAIDNDGQWLYRPDGHRYLDEPCADISEENGNLVFNTLSDRYLFVPADSISVAGPFKNIEHHGSRYYFAQNDLGMGCTVYSEKGEQLVYGGRIIFLFSKADSKYYFIVLNDTKTAVAYDENGKELFALDRKKMEKLPQPEWSDISVEKRVTKNSLTAYKALKRKR